MVDATLNAMPDLEAASEFLTLSKSHPSIDFTIELEENSLSRNECYQEWLPPRHHGTSRLDTRLLLHYHSHVPCVSTLVYVEVFFTRNVNALRWLVMV